MCLLLEVPIYHNGYHIPKLWAYVNHSSFFSNTKSSHYINKRTTVRKINNFLYSLSSLRHACCEKCLYITMVTIYPNYGHTLTIVFFFNNTKSSHYMSELRRSLQREKLANVFKFSQAYAMLVRSSQIS